MGHVAQEPAGRVEVLQHGQSAVWAVPQLGSRASSARAWWLWAARHSQGEAGPLDTQPLPRVLELAASKASSFTAFDHPGAAASACSVTVRGSRRARARRAPTCR
eukprot:scaffold21832_cov62-Phaeocystis_antarctica.AAC.4